MKVLFINGVYPAYSQTFVHDQIKQFSKMGHDVTVLARKKTGFIFQDSHESCNQGLLYTKPRNLKLWCRCFFYGLLNPVRSIKAVALRLNKKIHLQTMLASLQLRDAPDIIITHFGNNCDIGCQLKSNFFNKARNVVVFHGHDITSYVKKNSWILYKKNSEHIDLAICVNNYFRRSLTENTDIKRIKTIYLGTKVDNYFERIPHNQKELQILFTGRFVEKKAFFYLILACQILNKNGIKHKVHAVGDGPLLNDCKFQTISMQLGDSFHFYGSKEPRIVEELMSKCDCLVLPSIKASNGDMEGLPVVIMEAMVKGLPVISTYHSGIPELIKHEYNGFLVKEGDFIALAQMIKHVHELSQKERERIQENAFRSVKERHDIDLQNIKFVDAVLEVNNG